MNSFVYNTAKDNFDYFNDKIKLYFIQAFSGGVSSGILE